MLRTKIHSKQGEYVKIIIGSDHAGYALKEEIKGFLKKQDIEFEDAGTFNGEESCDYPDFAEKVAVAVSKGRFERGILICGTGIGMAMTANKAPGIRAAVANDTASATMSRAHNDANVLTLGSRLVTRELAREIVDVWLKTEFEGGRHQSRLDKIARLEQIFNEK